MNKIKTTYKKKHLILSKKKLILVKTDNLNFRSGRKLTIGTVVHEIELTILPTTEVIGCHWCIMQKCRMYFVKAQFPILRNFLR